VTEINDSTKRLFHAFTLVCWWPSMSRVRVQHLDVVGAIYFTHSTNSVSWIPKKTAFHTVRITHWDRVSRPSCYQFVYPILSLRQGRSERGLEEPLKSSIEWIFYGNKTGKNKTVLSTRSVLWASNMPKMRWRPGLRSDPAGGDHDAPQAPSR